MPRMVLLVLFIVVSITNSSAAVKVERANYKGWSNCYRVSNGEIELIVTGDVGPRVIRFGFVGGQNLFKEFPDQVGKSGEESFSCVAVIGSGRLRRSGGDLGAR